MPFCSLAQQAEDTAYRVFKRCEEELDFHLSETIDDALIEFHPPHSGGDRAKVLGPVALGL